MRFLDKGTLLLIKHQMPIVNTRGQRTQSSHDTLKPSYFGQSFPAVIPSFDTNYLKIMRKSKSFGITEKIQVVMKSTMVSIVCMCN